MTVALLLVAGLLTLNPLSISAHHREGHEKGGDASPPPPAENVSIDLINCDDNGIAKWNTSVSNTVTFKIVNVSGVANDVIQAVRDGVVRWNSVQATYNLVETADDPDILISVYLKIVPGYILGFAAVNCSSGDDGIQTVDISLGVRGLSLTGVVNLTAHEVGHGLGLGHTDSVADGKGDLMGPGFEQKEEGKQVVCPSNLDTGGLTATVDPYSISEPSWQQLAPC